MLFSCLPPDARIPGRFPGPQHPRGKYLTIDIHCHVLTEAAEAMFRSAGAVDRRPREVFANPRTREVTGSRRSGHACSSPRWRSAWPIWT